MNDDYGQNRMPEDERGYARNPNEVPPPPGYEEMRMREFAKKQSSTSLPIFLISFGLLWLLYRFDLLPTGRQFLGWGLIACGFVAFLLMGFTKRSVTVGPFLMYMGGAVIFSKSYPLDIFVAGGFIVYGLLLLISYSDFVPDEKHRNRITKR